MVLDGAVPAAADTMASRIDLAQAAHAVTEAITAAASLAHGLTQATAAQRLSAPARSIHRFLAGEHPAGPDRMPSHVRGLVNAADYANNRLVALPHPVRGILTTAGEAAAASTQACLPAAAAAAPRHSPPPPAAGGPTGPARDGLPSRRAQARPAPTLKHRAPSRSEPPR